MGSNEYPLPPSCTVNDEALSDELSPDGCIYLNNDLWKELMHRKLKNPINLLSSKWLGELVLGEGFHGDIQGQTEDAHTMLLVQLPVVRVVVPRVVGGRTQGGGWSYPGWWVSYPGWWVVVYTKGQFPECQSGSFIIYSEWSI